MIRKLIKLFTKKERQIAIVIFLFVLAGAGLEVISLALFAAFIGLFLDGNLEVYNWIIENSIIDLGEKSKVELIQILGVFTGILFVFKNIYLLLINYILHKFIYKKYTKVSVRLLKTYIEMPYINHLQIFLDLLDHRTLRMMLLF